MAPEKKVAVSQPANESHSSRSAYRDNIYGDQKLLMLDLNLVTSYCRNRRILAGEKFRHGKRSQHYAQKNGVFKFLTQCTLIKYRFSVLLNRTKKLNIFSKLSKCRIPFYERFFKATNHDLNSLKLQ